MKDLCERFWKAPLEKSDLSRPCCLPKTQLPKMSTDAVDRWSMRNLTDAQRHPSNGNKHSFFDIEGIRPLAEELYCLQK